MSEKKFDVVERIESLRIQRNWTVNYLAMEAGITQSTLFAMKQRHTPPKIDTLEALCDAFGITLAQFFTIDGQPEILKPDEICLLKSYRLLPEEKRTALVDLLK